MHLEEGVADVPHDLEANRLDYKPLLVGPMKLGSFPLLAEAQRAWNMNFLAP